MCTLLQTSHASPFGWLPDEVLLQIFKDGCDSDTQQAAYQSCRDIRDFCNRCMKSWSVEVRPADTLQEVQKNSSKTICPKTAYSIEKLTMRIWHSPSSIWAKSMQEHSHAAAHLEQLISDTFMSADTHTKCRTKQLTKVTSITLLLPYLFDVSSAYDLTVPRFLARFPNLQTLHTPTTGSFLSRVTLPSLQQVFCKHPISPQCLQAFASKHHTLQTLEFVMLPDVLLDSYQPALAQLRSLKHLSIARLGKPQQVSAGLLTGLTQLRALALHCFILTDVNLLRQLHITNLELGNVHVVPSNGDQEQWQPAAWPALKTVEISEKFCGSNTGMISETTARAILPLPHPGFQVIFPDSLMYAADAPPHPHVGFMAVAHMKSLGTLCLVKPAINPGLVLYNEAALQAMVDNDVNITDRLRVYGGPLYLELEDVAACLKFPAAQEMYLDSLVADTPECFSRLFLQCPLLRNVIVPKHGAQNEEQLLQPLDAFGLSCFDMGHCKLMIYRLDPTTV